MGGNVAGKSIRLTPGLGYCDAQSDFENVSNDVPVEAEALCDGERRRPLHRLTIVDRGESIAVTGGGRLICIPPLPGLRSPVGYVGVADGRGGMFADDCFSGSGAALGGRSGFKGVEERLFVWNFEIDGCKVDERAFISDVDGVVSAVVIGKVLVEFIRFNNSMGRHVRHDVSVDFFEAEVSRQGCGWLWDSEERGKNDLLVTCGNKCYSETEEEK